MVSHVALLLGALVAADPSSDPQVKKELDALQGTWKLVDTEWAGRKLTDEAKKANSVAVFKGDLMIRRSEGKEFTYRLELAPSKKPKQIDILMLKEGKVVYRTKGIYERDEDTLRLCTAQRKDGKRPGAFRTSKDRDAEEYAWVILVFRREK